LKFYINYINERIIQTDLDKNKVAEMKINNKIVIAVDGQHRFM
jgi:hypothetical protein